MRPPRPASIVRASAGLLAGLLLIVGCGSDDGETAVEPDPVAEEELEAEPEPDVESEPEAEPELEQESEPEPELDDGGAAGELEDDAVADPVEVSTQVAPIEEWITADEVAGDEPIDPLQPELLYPPGTEVVRNQEALADGDSVVTDLVIEGLEDAPGVFELLEEQLFEGPWEPHYQFPDASEVVEGSQVAWLRKYEDPTEMVELESGVVGEFARWEIDVQVVHDEGTTFIKLWINERV